MGIRGIAASNPLLMGFAVGLAPELRSPLATRVAPYVPVNATIGHYKAFNDKNAFQVYDTSRAIGGDRKRIAFDASDPKYDCTPQGLETTIDDSELDAAGDGDVMMLDQAKTRVMLGAAARSHEKKTFDVIRLAKAATANLGAWANPDVDPVAEIDSQIVAIATDTGYMPNEIVMDLAAWQAFRLHPAVVKRMPITEVVGVNTVQAASLLINPSINISIGATPFDTTKEGATQANQMVTKNDIFIFYSSPSPDLYDPSFAKTFLGGRGGIASVGRGRPETKPYDVVWLDWSEDIQVVSPKMGKRITFAP